MLKFFKSFKEIIVENKYFVLISFLYFLLRLINLTKPPLFNDEAIYLDWGFREIHKPGFLYYSLYDGKEPFLMWIYGVLESFFNPAFSGRIISVIAGYLTLAGIYKIAKYLFDKNLALISAVFYSIIPIFSFYDRQALMESSVAAVGIWSFYFLQKFLNEKGYKYPIFLGIVLGLGFFIKTTSIVFLIGVLFSIFFYGLINKKDKAKLIEKTSVLIAMYLLSIFLLIINPQFWNTLGSNSRYAFGIRELLSFPISIWTISILGNLEIGFFYLTPLFLIFCFFGGFILAKNINGKLFVFYFLACLIIETLTVRYFSQRYILPFLPFTVILASYVLFYIYRINKPFAKILFLISITLPLSLTLLQVSSQPNYINFMGRFTGINNSDYLSGFSSGYGVDEAINYIKNFSNGENITVGVAENTGNPESAVIANFANDKHIQVGYLDEKLIGTDISKYSCLNVSKPLIFIARDNQQGGLDKFLEKTKTIKNPYGDNTIGVYGLKSNCKGKTLYLYPKFNST